MTMALALAGIGSNLGDRAPQLDRAVMLLAAEPGIQLRARSRWHEMAPIGGPTGQGAFLNGALLLETTLNPESLRQAFVRVEQQLGRERGIRWQARTVDLDLLLYDDVVLATPDLVVPHPRMAFRRFVLAPAVEVAADMLHPQIGWTIRQLHAHLDSSPAYVALCGLPGVGKTRLAEELAARFQGHVVTLPAASPDALDAPAAAANARHCGSLELATEIEFLRQRSELLSRRQFEPPERLAISDFWYDQSLAYGRLYLNAGELAVLNEAAAQFGSAAALPRLRVLLTKQFLPQPLAAEASTRCQEARLQAELARLAARPNLGPLLAVPAADRALVLSEVCAAVEAMR